MISIGNSLRSFRRPINSIPVPIRCASASSADRRSSYESRLLFREPLVVALPKTRKVIDALKPEIGFHEAIADEKIGKLSIVGVGMRSHSGVAAKMFETLAREKINIEMISTSEIKISVIVELSEGEQAMKAVHAAFLGEGASKVETSKW